jgi:hypothetical protein
MIKELSDLGPYASIYLATPYSHPDQKIEKERFIAVSKAAAHLFSKGFFVFSPISHAHPMKVYGEMEGGWETWAEYDSYMLVGCEAMVILTLDGWKESEGVQNEVEIAKLANTPIGKMDPETYEVTF